MDHDTMLDHFPFPDLQIDESAEYPVRTVDAEPWIKKTEVVRSLSFAFPNLDADEVQQLFDIEDRFNQIRAADTPEELPSVESIREARETLIDHTTKIFTEGDLSGDPLGETVQKVGVIWSELNRITFETLSNEEHQFFVKNLVTSKLTLSVEVKTGYQIGSYSGRAREDLEQLAELTRNEMNEGDFSTPFFDGFEPVPAEEL